MPGENLASAQMPFWFLSVMFIANGGCMVAGILQLFGSGFYPFRLLNVFLYFAGGMGIAINVIILNNYQYKIRSD